MATSRPWDCAGRVVGADRAAAADGDEAVSVSGPQAFGRSGDAAGDPVRFVHGDRVAASAFAARVRFRGDLPAPAGRVASGRRVGQAARAFACPLAAGRRDRVATRGRRRQPCAGEKGGSETGPSPVDRGRTGSKHHLLVDATGIPLAFSVTGGNRNDVTQLIPLLDKVPPVRGPSADRAVVPTASLPIGVTTMTSTAGSSASGASHRSSPAARPRTARASEPSAGSSNAPSPGSTTSSGYSSATTAATRSTRPSSRSAAASSATDDSRTHFDSSS